MNYKALILILALIACIGVADAANVTLTPSLSGYTERYSTVTAEDHFPQIVIGAGNFVNVTTDGYEYLKLQSNTSDATKYIVSYHTELIYSLASLTPGTTITYGNIALAGTSTKSNTFGGTAWELVLVNCSPRSYTQLHSDDYQNGTSTVLLNAANVSYSSLTVNGVYNNNLSLNDQGMDYIRQNAGGYICLSPRISWDPNRVMGGTEGTGKTTQWIFNGSWYPNPPVLDIGYTPPPPTTAFSGTPSSGTVPLTVVFTDASTGSPTSWLWDFHDGSTTNNTQQSPVHTFSSIGTYEVDLRATSDSGSDWENRTSYITVNSALADFSMNASSDNNVPNVGLQLTDNAVGDSTFDWQFIDYGNQTLITTHFATIKNPVTMFGAGNFSIWLSTDIGDTSRKWLNISAGRYRQGLETANLSGFLLYKPDSILNTRIDTMPVHPMSAVWAGNFSGGSVIPYVSITADFPITVVDNNVTASTLLKIYSTPVVSNGTHFQIPDYLAIQDAGYADHNSYIINPDGKTLDSLYNSEVALARKPNGTYTESTAVHVDLNDYVIALGPDNYARLKVPLLRYDEVLEDNITHVMSVAVYRQQHTYMWPDNANNGQYSNPSYPPDGSRYRLKASFSEAGYTPNATSILHGLKKYGIMVQDNNLGSGYFNLQSDIRIREMFDVNYTTFQNVKSTDFEAVDEEPFMIDSHSHQAGTPQPPNSSFDITTGITEGVTPVSIPNMATSLSDFNYNPPLYGVPQWISNGSSIEHNSGSTSAIYKLGQFADGTFDFDIKRMSADNGAYDRSQFVFGAATANPVQYNLQDQYTLLMTRTPSAGSQTPLYEKATVVTYGTNNASWFTPFNLTHMTVVWAPPTISVYCDGVLAYTTTDPTRSYGYFGFSYIDNRVTDFSNFTFTGNQVTVNRTGTSPGVTKNFVDTSTLGASSWEWSINGVPFSTEKNPAYTFNSLGNYLITLKATSIYGDNTSSQWVNITSPQTSFSMTTVQDGGPTKIIQFSDTSNDGPFTWNWTFRDYSNSTGTPTQFSTAQNPSQMFGRGNFSVTLTTESGTSSSQWINVTSAGTNNQSEDFALIQNITLSSANSIYKARVDTLPIDPRSTGFIQNSSPTATNWISGGQMHISVINSSMPKQNFTSVYWSPSDNPYGVNLSLKIPLPIPDNAFIAWLGGDNVMSLIDKDTNFDYEIYNAQRGLNKTFSSKVEAVWDRTSNTLPAAGHFSQSGSGLQTIPTVLRYAEVQSNSINHALDVLLIATKGVPTWPATSGFSPGNVSEPGYGQRFRLNASFDISHLSIENQRIAIALKKYGAIYMDNTADIHNNWLIAADNDPGWPSTTNANWNVYGPIATDWEIVNASALMISPDSGEAAPQTLTWLWDFGDGSDSVQQNPQHTYYTGGTFTVSLTVTNGTPAVANFAATPLSGTAPLTVDFTDASTTGAGTTTSDTKTRTNYITVNGPLPTPVPTIPGWSTYRNQPLSVFLNIWTIIIGTVAIIVVGLALYLVKWMMAPQDIRNAGGMMHTLLVSMLEGVIIIIVLFLVIMYMGGTIGGL